MAAAAGLPRPLSQPDKIKTTSLPTICLGDMLSDIAAMLTGSLGICRWPRSAKLM
ncbi:hypothetical protein GCM10007857_83520 [Bradyrhizobium iriomotense]|uniref:Uncharacterized protein n=1 Tax=Bradyrhizobium iriomotense TaxID=441950 RepID=A0ABQ6BB27_9BRAD|nr:hypothetical protein GCM10007857_83520 [Bradyrhizobium iriomotense]